MSIDCFWPFKPHVSLWCPQPCWGSSSSWTSAGGCRRIQCVIPGWCSGAEAPLALVSIWAACDTGATGMCSHCWQHLQEKAELRGAVELRLLSFCCKKRCLVMLLAVQQAQMRSWGVVAESLIQHGMSVACSGKRGVVQLSVVCGTRGLAQLWCPH